MTNNVMIGVKGLIKRFGNLEVLSGVDVDIHNGEKVAVIGPSGSGKSTFLRCLNCMEDPTGGAIIFNGVNIADMRVATRISAMLTPLKMIAPPVGSSIQLRQRRKVDLPEPDGPMTATFSPLWISTSTPESTSRLPKRFMSPLTPIITLFVISAPPYARLRSLFANARSSSLTSRVIPMTNTM